MPIKSTYDNHPILALLIWLLSASQGWSFENLSHRKESTLKCQTTCHTAENIIKSKEDKINSPQCQECHGVVDSAVKTRSPFLPAGNVLRTANKAMPRPLEVSNQSQPVQKGARKKPDASPPPPNMAFIPAGEFIMGSNERWDDESPEYIEKTSAFYIDIYEVTNQDYKSFVSATHREPPHHWPNGEIPKNKEKHPVVYVNWFDANDYCTWAGKRLPTEEEWEKAARGEEGLIYPWGNEWSPKKSNNPYKHSTGTEPTGSYPEGKSPYGLYDMSGNVWEWVDSYYLPHPGNAVPRKEYGKDKRILKGGSWFDCLSYGCGLSAPTFNRSFFTPEVRNNSFGFRCAKTAE